LNNNSEIKNFINKAKKFWSGNWWKKLTLRSLELLEEWDKFSLKVYPKTQI
jgi:hypothetical protein